VGRVRNGNAMVPSSRTSRSGAERPRSGISGKPARYAINPLSPQSEHCEGLAVRMQPTCSSAHGRIICDKRVRTAESPVDHVILFARSTTQNLLLYHGRLAFNLLFQFFRETILGSHASVSIVRPAIGRRRRACDFPWSLCLYQDSSRSKPEQWRLNVR